MPNATVIEKIKQELLENNKINELKAVSRRWPKKAKKEVDKIVSKIEEEKEINKAMNFAYEGMVSIRDKVNKLSTDEIAEAIVKNNGWLSDAARELGVSTVALKERIEKTKYLKDVLDNTKELKNDLVEKMIFQRIIEKNDSISAMFWLKCQAHERGWTEKSSSESRNKNKEKTINIRVLPANNEIGKSEVKALESSDKGN